MRTLMSYLLAGGATVTAAVLFLTGAHVDTVTGVTAFYTNSARTGWVYPNDNTYTSEFVVGVQKTIPVIYGGQGEADVAGWNQTPGLGGSFIPSLGTISSYRWTPSSVGPVESVFRVYKSSEPANYYEQKFYFMVIPEPGLGMAVLFGVAVLAGRRRFRSSRTIMPGE